MAKLLVPSEIGIAIRAAPEEREGTDGVAAVRRLVGLDMAVQMGDVAHLVMAYSGIAPAGIRDAADARLIAPETVGERIAAAVMTIQIDEHNLLGWRGHLLDGIGFVTLHDLEVTTVGAVVVPVRMGRGARAEKRLGVKIAAGAGTRVARPSFKICVGNLHHGFIPERMLEGRAVGPLVARSAVVSGGRKALVVTRVHGKAGTELFHVAGAVDGVGLVTGFGEGGEEHGGQDRDDGNDDQQLDQREMTGLFHVRFPLGWWF